MKDEYNPNGETEEVSRGRVPISKDNGFYFVGEDLRDFGEEYNKRLSSYED